jgi:hypothetical protein
MLDKLHYVATSPTERKALDEELYYLQFVEDTFGKGRDALAAEKAKLAEKDKVIAEKDNALAAEKSRNASLAVRIAALEQRNK